MSRVERPEGFSQLWQEAQNALLAALDVFSSMLEDLEKFRETANMMRDPHWGHGKYLTPAIAEDIADKADTFYEQCLLYEHNLIQGLDADNFMKRVNQGVEQAYMAVDELTDHLETLGKYVDLTSEIWKLCLQWRGSITPSDIKKWEEKILQLKSKYQEIEKQLRIARQKIAKASKLQN